jgi:hypothetical protein
VVQLGGVLGEEGELGQRVRPNRVLAQLSALIGDLAQDALNVLADRWEREREREREREKEKEKERERERERERDR